MKCKFIWVHAPCLILELSVFCFKCVLLRWNKTHRNLTFCQYLMIIALFVLKSLHFQINTYTIKAISLKIYGFSLWRQKARLWTPKLLVFLACMFTEDKSLLHMVGRFIFYWNTSFTQKTFFSSVEPVWVHGTRFTTARGRPGSVNAVMLKPALVYAFA